MSETITRSYDDYASAKAVVSDLKAAGFRDSDISMVAHRHSGDDSIMDGVATGAGAGAAIGGTAGLLTGIGLMAIPGVGPVVAAGWLAATAVGALAGGAAGAAAGGIVDALTSDGVDRRDADVYAETVRRGGTVVSVRTTDARRAEAAAIMDRSGPIDIVARRRAYEETGWAGYDPVAQPYTGEELERERRRYHPAHPPVT